MLYRHVNSTIWSSDIGSFNSSLSKGPTSTTWIWDLHASPHDFSKFSSLENRRLQSTNTTRKVTSSGLAHLGIVTFSVSGMLFHGSYFSNYTEWLIDPIHVKPTSHIIWSIVGQGTLNYDVGGYSQGLYITSALFQLWRSQGILSLLRLKWASLASMLVTLLLLGLAFYIMHISPTSSPATLISYRCTLILLGLSSITWAGHVLHIALPSLTLVNSGVDL